MSNNANIVIRASDEERFYQCLTCLHIESCNLDEESEDERGMCGQYSVDKNIEKKLQNSLKNIFLC